MGVLAGSISGERLLGVRVLFIVSDAMASVGRGVKLTVPCDASCVAKYARKIIARARFSQPHAGVLTAHPINI
eukprot:78917-Pleurochrysis_carterae.AAC.1